MCTRIDHMSAVDTPYQVLMPSPFFLSCLQGQKRIVDFEKFQHDMSVFVMSAPKDNAPLIKEAFLNAVHLVTEHWKNDSNKNPRQYADCFTTIGKMFLHIGEAELARDCQCAALNIGYTSSEWYVHEDTFSKRTSLCRLVHIFRTFPHLLEQESKPSQAFIDAVGSDELFQTEEGYRHVQEACREMARGDLPTEEEWGDCAPFIGVSREFSFLRALFILNNIGKKLPIDLDAFKITDELVMRVNLLMPRLLDIHHDLQMDPNYVLRSLETKCLYDEVLWDGIQTTLLPFFSSTPVSPLNLDDLRRSQEIECVAQFKKSIDRFDPSTSDRSLVKEAFLNAVRLIATKKEEEDHPNDYAACLTAIGKVFFKIGEAELARDCQFLVLNIGFGDDTVAQRTALCRLVHIYRTFPQLLELDSQPARDFAHAIGLEEFASISLHYPYLQDACREMLRNGQELEESFHYDEDIPIGERKVKNIPFLKALLFLNSIGEELPKAMQAQEQVPIDSIEGHLDRLKLIKKALRLHRDLNMHPDNVLRDWKVQYLYDESTWEFVQERILALFSSFAERCWASC